VEVQIICERSEQKKKLELLYAELSHSVPCVSKQFATEKYSPQFSIFYFPQLFPGSICLHLSMVWTLPGPSLFIYSVWSGKVLTISLY